MFATALTEILKIMVEIFSGHEYESKFGSKTLSFKEKEHMYLRLWSYDGGV